MVDFVVSHKLLNPSQHGFVLEEITKWVDEGSPVKHISRQTLLNICEIMFMLRSYLYVTLDIT